ncbi:MAG: thioredoxin [Bacteroidota bacterium]
MELKDKFLAAIESDQPVLVDFFATWCGPCMAMNPILEEVKKEIAGQGTIFKFDVDANPKFASEMGVMGVPTFMVFKNGKKLWHEAGTKTAAQLLEIILEKV